MGYSEGRTPSPEICTSLPRGPGWEPATKGVSGGPSTWGWGYPGDLVMEGLGLGCVTLAKSLSLSGPEP